MTRYRQAASYVAIWGVAIAVLAAFALAGCAGTQATFDGQICGQQVRFSLVDRKDRGQFEVDAQCPDNQGSVRITTTDSSTSAVIEAQAKALESSAAALGTLAGQAAAAAATGR